MPENLPARSDDGLLNAKLARLGRAAKQAHERAKKCAFKAVEHMVRAGQALCKARDLCDTPEWERFLAVHFKKTERTAQRYMKLARNWAQLQAIAPPEALTSQRQVFRLLNTLLVGERPPSEAATPPRKQRASGAVPALPAPESQPTTTNAADHDWRRAARQMHEQTLRVLEGLTGELETLSPPHYLVLDARDAVVRAYHDLAAKGRLLFRPDESKSSGEQGGAGQN